VIVVAAVAAVLLLWWAGTAAVVYLDGLPARTFVRSFVASTLLLVAAVLGAHALLPATTTAAAFLGFLCGFLAWAWGEVGFYTGFVTGPRRERCEEGCAGWRHLGHALLASLWHELALLGVLAVLIWASGGGGSDGNRVALWTYAILLAGHESARLNVLLGVRNVNAEFLPEHLRYLEGFLRRRPLNALFPFAFLGFAAATLWLAGRAMASPAAFEAVSAWLLTATAGVATLEHLMLVVPLPVGRLWSWSLRARARAASSPAEG